MALFVCPMYDKPQSQSSVYTPAYYKGMLLSVGLMNSIIFLCGLYIILMETFFKMLHTLSVTTLTYVVMCQIVARL